jgi:hypothetical protein
MMVHTYAHNSWETEAGGPWLAWATSGRSMYLLSSVYLPFSIYFVSQYTFISSSEINGHWLFM